MTPQPTIHVTRGALRLAAAVQPSDWTLRQPALLRSSISTTHRRPFSSETRAAYGENPRLHPNVDLAVLLNHARRQLSVLVPGQDIVDAEAGDLERPAHAEYAT